MSEQEKPMSFMEKLNQWSDDNIIQPLLYESAKSAAENDTETFSPDWENTVEQIKKAIRTKVLESYRNGQAAGPAKPRSAFKPRGK